MNDLAYAIILLAMIPFWSWLAWVEYKYQRDVDERETRRFRGDPLRNLDDLPAWYDKHRGTHPAEIRRAILEEGWQRPRIGRPDDA